MDIIKILTDKDKTIFDNILNSFVGIAAVQIGLTDILKELGVKPDNIIGEPTLLIHRGETKMQKFGRWCKIVIM